jgi:hypothetical protein
MRAALACALLLAGCMACISAMTVKEAHRDRAGPHADAAAAAAEAKTAIIIPCAVVPLAECTVDAGCKVDKGGKCVVDPVAPSVNCTALMSSSGAELGKSALDVASAAMTAQDKITAAAMAAPDKNWQIFAVAISDAVANKTSSIAFWTLVVNACVPLFASRRAGQCGEGFVGSSSSGCEACSPGKFMSYQGRVTCSGHCPCGSHGSSSGSFSDGPGNYGNSQTCSWLIVSGYPTHITISFASFSTESGYDHVTIAECSSASCRQSRNLARLSGNDVSASTVYTTSTGFLKVVFNSDSSTTSEGFEAAWSMQTIMMTECPECPAGTYSDVSGSSSCTVCPAGSFQNATGSSSCSWCAAGKYASSAAVVCWSCPAGTYSERAGSSSCIGCPAGSFQNATGSSSCSLCAAGKYCSEASSAAVDCWSCPAGTYSERAGSSSCIGCPAGSFQKATGATGCDACPPNSDFKTRFCECEYDSGPKTCDPCHASSTMGSRLCLCDSGYSGDGTTSCEVCSPGKYRPGGSVTCSGPCPCGSHGPSSGSFSDGPGNYGNKLTCSWLVASNRPKNKFDIKVTFTSFNTKSSDFVTINECSSASCEERKQLIYLSGNDVSPRTMYTFSGTGFLEVMFRSDHPGPDTYAGFEAAWSMRTIMMTKCPECPAGTYTNASGSSSCTLCPAGSFQNATGATASHACVACPPKSSSGTTRSICLCDWGYRPDQVAWSWLSSDNKLVDFTAYDGDDYVTLYAAGDTECVACDCGEKEKRTYCAGYCEERERKAERRAKAITAYDVGFVVLHLVCEVFALCYICGDGDEKSVKLVLYWFLFTDLGFSVGKLYPGPSYNCESWGCRSVTHVCTMTLCSFPCQLIELMVLRNIVKSKPGSKATVFIKIVEYSANLAFVFYDAATQDPPGVGTKVLVVFTCLAEVLLIAIEAHIFFKYR